MTGLPVRFLASNLEAILGLLSSVSLAPCLLASLPPCLQPSLPLEWLPYGQTHFSGCRRHGYRLEVSCGSGGQTAAGGLRLVSGIKTAAAAQLGCAAGKTGVVRLVRANARASGPHGLLAAPG